MIDRWYKEKYQQIFRERLDYMFHQFEYKKLPNLIVRDMKRRWGSFSKGGQIILNPKLIQLPKDCIDYVITHELCHVRYKNHDKLFFNLLQEKYLQWEKTKEKLETMGAIIH